MKITITLSDGSKFHYASELASVLVGRSSTAQFSVPAEALSRQHALIENDHGLFYVTDLNSSNGVFIDGKRIGPNQRTQFSTFQTLSLGAAECHVEDSEVLDTQVEVNETLNKPLKDFRSETRTKIQIPRKDSKPFRLKNEKENSTTTLIFILLVCGAGYYFYKDSSEPEQPIAISPTTSTPAQVKFSPSPPMTPPDIVDEFLEQSTYEERYSKRTCLGFSEVCEELKLDEKDMEGVLERSGEYFVYMKSSKRYNQVFSALASDPTRPDIVSLYTVIKSNFYNQLLSDKIYHIHLILLNDENKLYRGYRFKKSQLGQSRLELLNGIRSALTEKNSDSFWTKAHQHIPVLEFKK